MPFTTTGLTTISERLEEIRLNLDPSNPAFRQSVLPMEQELHEINEQERLAGLNRDGGHHAPVTYRGGVNSRAARRGGIGSVRRAGVPSGGSIRGGAQSGESLTTEQYQRLTGPPLAPQGSNSRVVKNYYSSFQFAANLFLAIADWRPIRARNGREFFPGTGSNQPRREISSLSGKAIQRLRQATLIVLRKGF